jgi:hypothetical protein
VETPISFVKTPDGKVYKAHNYAGTYWHVPNQPTYTAIKELLTSMKIPFSTEKGGLPAGGYAHNTALIIVKISSHETRTLLPGCGDIAARFRL